jgi:hypothetical protein
MARQRASPEQLRQLADSWRALWVTILHRYDDLISMPAWAHLRPFRDVVAALASSSWAGRLCPGTSHENLAVHVPDRWPPRVVQMFPSAERLRIVRQGELQADGVRHEEVPMKSAVEALVPHLEWAAG